MLSLDLVNLAPLMSLSQGLSGVRIGLIDGPVLGNHPDLSDARILQIRSNNNAFCSIADSEACRHGTFVGGILAASRHSVAPAICPGCTLLVRPVFTEFTAPRESIPNTSPLELAAAIIDCISAGAHVINLSLGLAHPSPNGEKALGEALDYALQRNVIIVAAAGNQATLGSSPITRHPWVIPVTSCNFRGHPINESTLGRSIGKRGLSAPGDRVTSLNSQGSPLILSGSSFAVPFVTGAIALLHSLFPNASTAQIRLAITQSTMPRRQSIIPPLLDAAAAFRILQITSASRAA